MIDVGWPHQVAVPAELLYGAGYPRVHLFCEGLSLCPRNSHFRRDDRDYVVFCFAEVSHAERFRARFNGEIITPRTERRRARP